MRHLLAVNQGGHPGAIDGAVSLCEMCLSKPTHSATLSPCPGSLTFVYCPLSTLPSLSLSSTLSVRLLPVFLQRHYSPLIPDPITDSLGTHLSSSNPLVFVMECFTNTSAGDSGLIYMWFFYRCFLCLCVPPSALNATVTNPFSPVFFPLSFSRRPLPPPLFTHPSSLYLTGDKVWASS